MLFKHGQLFRLCDWAGRWSHRDPRSTHDLLLMLDTADGELRRELSAPSVDFNISWSGDHCSTRVVVGYQVVDLADWLLVVRGRWTASSAAEMRVVLYYASAD